MRYLDIRPPITPSSWSGKSLSDLAGEISAGVSTSQSLVQECLQRIEKYDALCGYHATIDINQDALAQAQQIDREIARGKRLEALAGVPVIVKANIGTTDMPNSAGNSSLVHLQPEYDSDVVRSLKDAGAIVVATSNTSEYAWHGTFTRSTVGGATGNFFDSRLSASGSSGGSAVSVAAGFAPFALGTDTCGSITGPAAHASLVGFRPTHDSISMTGVVPLSAAQDTVGVITRSATDAQWIAEILNPLLSTHEYKREGLTGTFLTWPFETVGGPGTQHTQERAEARALVERAACLLFESVGAKVQELTDLMRIDFAHHYSGSDFTDITHGIDAYLKNTKFRGIANSSLPRCVQTLEHTSLSTETVESWRAYDARFDESVIADNKRRTADNKQRFKRYLEKQEIDFLVFATAAETASENWAGTAAADISANTGSPSIQIPVGFTSAGLPAGMTIVCRPDQDGLALWLGRQLQNAQEQSTEIGYLTLRHK